MGWALYLKAKGIEVSVISPNRFPEFLKWLPENENIIIFQRREKKALKLLNEAELIFLIDLNDILRTGKIEEYLKNIKTSKILIDHHPALASFTDLIIAEPSACATSELIYEIIESLGDEEIIDFKIATCLATGIITDTGSLSYGLITPGTFLIMSRLLQKGIDKDFICTKVYDNFSADRMRLMGYALYEKMIVLPEYHTAYIILDKVELERFNFAIGDSEGFVNLPLSIKGIVFSAFFMQKNDMVKISFRSKGNFEVNKFAEKHFNGGGHKNAAGGEDKLPLEDSVKRFVGLLKQYADSLK
ncbi:MAG: DHH family phosphoesterase [Bacteroidia bacterium]|nr:DHH family phosphoesterase [Bacteroidia bacterium]